MVSKKYGDILHIHDDRENVTKKMQDNSVSLVFEDIPFGVRKEEEWDNFQHYIDNVGLWLREGLRITQHAVIWFCASRNMPYIFNAIKGEEDLFKRMHIWNKPIGSQFAGASNNNVWYSIEPILVFSKNWDITKKYGTDMVYGYDTFDYRTIPHKEYLHPTSKPVPLLRKIIGYYSAPNETIFDGFSGSGSLGIACLDMGRKAIMVEQSEEHYNNAGKRIEKHLSAPKMFIGVEDIEKDTEDYDTTMDLFGEETNK